MKRTLISTMMGLAFIASAVAQTENERVPARGFAVFSATDTFHPYGFTHHTSGDNDILIETLYPDICHSDLHAAWDEHTAHGINGVYPMPPKRTRHTAIQDGKVMFRYVINMSTIK